METDAFATGLEAVLAQRDDSGAEYVIAYASRTTNSAERNYASTELECLAIMWATQLFRPYIWGTEFTLITDHQALT